MSPSQQEAGSDLGALADPRAEVYLAPCSPKGFEREDLMRFLRSMLLIRTVEEQIAHWVENGVARCPCHLGIGQEAIAVGVANSLRQTDRLFGNHRSHAHFLALGCSPLELLAEVLGRNDGCSRGMGGSMHLQGIARGFYGSVPIVGATIPVAVGAALAAKLDKTTDIAVAFFGDGACEEGVLHESLNLAAVLPVPVLFVCENNQYSSHLDIRLRQPSDSVSRYAEAHRIEVQVVDGNDVCEVARVTRGVVDRMRSRGVPGFLELVTYRWLGHVGAKEDVDVGVRRKTADIVAWKKRDPIRRLEETLLHATRCVTQSEIDTVHVEVREQVADAAEQASASPFPRPETLLRYVYSKHGSREA